MDPESRLRRAWVARIGETHPLPLATTSQCTTASGGGVGPAECAASAVTPQRLRWDPLQVVLALLVLVQVWRVQDLLPVIAIPGLPVLCTLAVLLLLVLDRDPRRRLDSLKQPVVRAGVALLLLATLSIPGSLYPRYSASFVVTDYMRSVALMLMIATSVRGVGDFRRLAWLQIVGVTLFCAVSLARGQVDPDGRLVVRSYYNSNDLALLIVSTLPLTLYLWRRPAGLVGRAVLLAATSCVVMTLGRTGSRGGVLGVRGGGGLPVGGISRHCHVEAGRRGGAACDSARRPGGRPLLRTHSDDLESFRGLQLAWEIRDGPAGDMEAGHRIHDDLSRLWSRGRCVPDRGRHAGAGSSRAAAVWQALQVVGGAQPLHPNRRRARRPRTDRVRRAPGWSVPHALYGPAGAARRGCRGSADSHRLPRRVRGGCVLLVSGVCPLLVHAPRHDCGACASSVSRAGTRACRGARLKLLGRGVEWRSGVAPDP